VSTSLQEYHKKRNDGLLKTHHIPCREREGLKPNITYAIKSGIRNPFKFCRYLCSLSVLSSSLFPLQE
jgi:hypothetical protein